MSNCNKSSLVIRCLIRSTNARLDPITIIRNRHVYASSDTYATGIRWQRYCKRHYVSTSSTSAGKNTLHQYVSPFAELFESIANNASSSIQALADIGDIGAEVTPVRRVLKCGIPEDVLRFSSMTYGRTLMAPTVHPNEHRVVLKVNKVHLPLSDVEMTILREIVGDRLNDERSELRLTSNQFGSRIENKRHLVSMLDRIILSCQRLGSELQKDINAQKGSTDSQLNVG